MEGFYASRNPFIRLLSLTVLSFIHDISQIVDKHRANDDRSNAIHIKIKQCITRVSCQKGPTRHAYAWQIGPFWQDTLDYHQSVGDHWLQPHCFPLVGILSHTQRQNWEFYDLDILYVDWIQWIWVGIYVLQIFWVLYSFIALCRETKYGSLVMNPPIMPSSIFFSYIPGLAATMGWLVLFDIRQYSAYSSILMMAATTFLCITMALSLHALKTYEEEAKAEGFLADVWAVRVIVQNCISSYGAWTAVVTCYTVAMIMYGFNLLEKDIAQYAALGVMMAYLLLWTGVDLFVTQYLTHFVLGPYLVFFIVFLQPFLRYYSGLNTYFVLATVFMGFTLLLFILKLIILVGRCCCKGPKRLYIHESEFGAVEYVPSSSEEGSITGPNPYDQEALAVEETAAPYWRSYINKPLSCSIYFKKCKTGLVFLIISQHRYGTSNWNSSTWETMTSLFCMANAMSVENLATQGVRASAGIELTYSS